jgi:hypothetical protein
MFAVESIRRWWRSRGCPDHPGAERLLVTVDCGGSNGYRYRLWKAELAAFAAEAGLTVTMCHFPPGTSKWNKIEHQLFSHITMNWRRRPLTSHEVVVNSIAATHPHRAERSRRARHRHLPDRDLGRRRAVQVAARHPAPAAGNME